MSTGQVACTYAATILHDDDIPVTAENIATLLKSANVAVEPYWPRLFAKLAEKTNLEDLIVNAAGSGSCSAPLAMPSPSAAASAAAPAVEEKKEELEEESDDDMPPINLFD